MSILSGIHPVAEALRSNHPLDRVLVAQGAGGPRLQEIVDMARRAAVTVRFEPRAALDRLAGTSAHQGVIALGDELKESGHWIYGLDERGTEDYDKVDYSTPTVLVLGGEGKGLHEQVRKHCDVLVRIPMAGKISSLNVSVAAGVVLFEWRRRRLQR